MGDVQQQGGLLSFINSPQALALAQGLLSGSRDQYGRPQRMGPAMGQGLLQMQKAQDLERQRKMQEAYLKMARERFGLDKAKLGLQQQSLQQQALQQQRMQDLFSSLAGQGGAGLLSGLSPQDAQMAGLLGSVDPSTGIKYLSQASQKAAELDRPTTQTLTTNQKIIQGVDAALPVIDDLIKADVPFQAPWFLGGEYTTAPFARGEQAQYETKKSEAVESIISAFGLQPTAKGIETANKMVTKFPGEGDAAYRARMEELKKTMIQRRKNAQEVTGAISDKSLLDDLRKDLERYAGE